MNRIIKNPEKFRENLVNKLHDLFIKIKGEEIKKSYSINLEKGIYNKSLNDATDKNIIKKWDNNLFVNLYISKFRSIYFNITLDLINKFLSKKIKVHTIANMNHQEWKPEKWKTLLEQKKIKDENRYEAKMEATTDSYTCRKCKSKRCWHYQLQTRSADEPMTTYVTCLDCSNKWKC